MCGSGISRAIGVPKIFVLATVRIVLSTTAATVTAAPVSSSQFTVQPIFGPTVQLPRMCGQQIVQFRVRPHSFDTGQWNFIQHRFGILFRTGIDQSHGDLQIGFHRRHVQRCPTRQHVRQFNVASFVDQQSNQITFALGIGGGPMHGAPPMDIRGIRIGTVTPQQSPGFGYRSFFGRNAKQSVAAETTTTVVVSSRVGAAASLGGCSGPSTIAATIFLYRLQQ